MQNLKARLKLEELDDRSLKAHVAASLFGKELADLLYGPQKMTLNSEIYGFGTLETLSKDLQLSDDFNQLRKAIADDLIHLLEVGMKHHVRTGFPTCVWMGIEKLEIDPHIPGLAEIAFDSGHYKLALRLGLENHFSQARAWILLGKEAPALNLSDLEFKAIEVMRLRQEGKYLIGAEIFENEILPRLSEITDQDCLGEIYNIAASAHFLASSYVQAIEIYSLAYSCFESSKNYFRMGVCAYNAAMTALYMCNKPAQHEWLSLTQNSLRNIHFDSLSLSLRIHHCRILNQSENYSEATKEAKPLLDLSYLSLFQRIEILQIYASSAVELGQVLDANIYSTFARQLIFSNKAYQYEFDQLSLENNIESLCYLRTTKIALSNVQHRTENKTVYAEYRMSTVRQMLNENNISGLRKAMEDLRRELPEKVISQIYTRDIELATSGYNDFPEKRSRGLQTQVLQALRHRNIPFAKRLLMHIDEDLKTAPSPWKHSLFLITKSFLQISQGLTSESATDLITALDVTSTHGLMRLYSISLGLLVVCDSHFEFQWLEHLKGLEANDRIAIQDFFKATIGNHLSTLYLVISNNRRDLSLDQKNSEVDLIINQEAGEVIFKGETLPLSGQSLLFLLLNHLARAQKQGLSKEEIISHVWGYNYEPQTHDPLVYINIKRLRDLVPIEIHAGRYRISPEISWQFVVPAAIEDRKLNLTPRQVSIVNYIQKNDDKSVSRSEIVELLGISPRTALRELTEMVDKKFLVRHGAGRSARYTSPMSEELI